MNRHIPAHTWSDLEQGNSRKQSLCRRSTTIIGTPGITHWGEPLVQMTPSGMKFTWCPVCIFKFGDLLKDVVSDGGTVRSDAFVRMWAEVQEVWNFLYLHGGSPDIFVQYRARE